MARNLPNGKQQFISGDGIPFALGSVYFYAPTTTTFKDTWQNSGKTILNSNPVVLDADGYAIIWGEGLYRQILKDALGNTVWDQEVTSGEGAAGMPWGGLGGGAPNAQTVTVPGHTEVDGSIFEFRPRFTNTAGTTIQVNLGVPRAVYAFGPTGPVALTGGELITFNVYQLVWVTTLGGYVIANSTSLTFNSLISETTIKEEDYAPFFRSVAGANRKILIADWLKSLTNGLANEREEPALEDVFAIYNATDDRVDKIFIPNILKIVSKLDVADQDIDVNDYQILLVSLADSTLRRANVLRGIGPWRWQVTRTVDDGATQAKIANLDGFSIVRVTIDRAVPTTDDQRLTLEVSIDNGANWLITDYLNSPDTAHDTSMWVNDAGAGDRVGNNFAGAGLSGTVILTGLSATVNKNLSGVVTWKKPSDAISSYMIAAEHKTNDVVNAIRFKWSSGTFRRGRFVVEGIQD